MKLCTIAEGAAEKAIATAKDLISGALGAIVTDVDALLAHILNGIKNTEQLLLQDNHWWEKLFALQFVTSKWEQLLVTESIGQSFMAIKKLAILILQAIINSLGHGYGGHGHNIKQTKQYMTINAMTVGYFLDQLGPLVAQEIQDNTTSAPPISAPAPTTVLAAPEQS